MTPDEDRASGRARRARRGGWAWAAALALLGAALAAWSWRRWADVQVDFGRELYAAWRVAAGERLYADLAWFQGPLSAWWNGAWFRVAGVSWTTLIAVNLALVALTAAGLHALVRRAADARAARAAVALFLAVFAFSQYAGIANYDFVAPYSHDLVHGFQLSVAALLLLGALARRPARMTAFAAGVALGLAFLTKAEAFAAGALACGARLALLERGRRHLASVLFGFQLPLVLACAWLARDLPADEAARGVLGSWLYVGNEALRALPFYRANAGLDAPRAEALRDLAWGAGAAAFVGAWWLAAARMSRARGTTRPALAFATLAGAASAGAALGLTGLDGVARAFPWAAAFLLALGVARRRASSDPAERAAGADAVALAVLALGFALKSGLRPRIVHYGFVLALPGAVATCALLVGELPRRLDARGRAGGFLAAALAGALAALALGHLAWSHRWYHGDRAKTVLVGEGGDRLWAGSRGEPLRDALAVIERDLPPDGTLLVLPEGVMLNYLARRRTPTRYLNFMPPELILWPEEQVVAALEASPPDAVLFVHKDTSEYGVPYFGRGLYGHRITEWVEDRYAPGPLFGAPPLQDGRFGAQLWWPKTR